MNHCGCFRARLVYGYLNFHISVLSFHNSNSKPITHHPNSIFTQKFQHFCLVTKLSHISQSIFAKMMDPPTDNTQKNMVATRIFKPSYTETQLHHHQWQTLHPPPSTKLHLHHHQRQIQKSTTTTTTTNSLQHNHNLHQKIQMNQKTKPTNNPQPNVFD